MDSMVSAHDIVLYGKKGCGYCRRAKEALSLFQVDTPFTFKVYEIANTDELTASQQGHARTNLQSR